MLCREAVLKLINIDIINKIVRPCSSPSQSRKVSPSGRNT